MRPSLLVPVSLAFLLIPTIAAAAADDPPLRLKLSDEVVVPGERLKVEVKVAQGGYLLVLRADASGRVRVLFPLDPADSAAVQGGREYDIRGRGGREGFLVDHSDGAGMVLAAVSKVPFNFQEFTRGVHWDYRALAASDSAADAEAALLDWWIACPAATTTTTWSSMPSIRGPTTGGTTARVAGAGVVGEAGGVGAPLTGVRIGGGRACGSGRRCSSGAGFTAGAGKPRGVAPGLARRCGESATRGQRGPLPGEGRRARRGRRPEPGTGSR